MTKKFLVGCACALAFTSNAQYQLTGITASGESYYSLNSDFYPFDQQQIRDHFSGQTLEYTFTNKKGKVSYQTQTSLNAKGRIERVYRIKDNNRYLSSTNNYYRDSLLQERTEYRNGKMNSSMVLSYNEDYKMTGQENFRRGKLNYSSEMNYSNGQLTETKVFTGKKRKMSNRYEFEYFGNEQRKETRIYDRKGELKSKIRYECKDEGTDELKKNEKMVCIYEEGEKDFFKTINYTKTRKGNTKTISIFRASDSSIVEYLRYNEKEELQTKITYHPDLKKIVSSEYFNKGNLRFANHYEYKGELLTKQWYENKKGKGTSTEFTYTENGAPLSFTRFDSKKRVTGTATIKVINQ